MAKKSEEASSPKRKFSVLTIRTGGSKDSAMDKAFVLHADDLRSNAGITYNLLSSPKGIHEHSTEKGKFTNP